VAMHTRTQQRPQSNCLKGCLQIRA
jgi:hypothetical protein